jgi:hypothetical protein
MRQRRKPKQGFTEFVKNKLKNARVGIILRYKPLNENLHGAKPFLASKNGYKKAISVKKFNHERGFEREKRRIHFVGK